VALAELAQLRLPAAMVGGELVHEQDRRTLPDLLVIELHLVGRRRVGHGEALANVGLRATLAEAPAPKQNGRRCGRPSLSGDEFGQLARAAQPMSMRRRHAVWRKPSRRCAVVRASARVEAAQVRYSRSETREAGGCRRKSRAKAPAPPLSLSSVRALATLAACPKATTRPVMV